MKIIYWILGIAVVAGAGYVGYQYGKGNIKLELPKSNVVVPVNMDTSETQNVLQNTTYYPVPLTWPTNMTPVGNYLLNSTLNNSLLNTVVNNTVNNKAVEMPFEGLAR